VSFFCFCSFVVVFFSIDSAGTQKKKSVIPKEKNVRGETTLSATLGILSESSPAPEERTDQAKDWSLELNDMEILQSPVILEKESRLKSRLLYPTKPNRAFVLRKKLNAKENASKSSYNHSNEGKSFGTKSDSGIN
jgi:hypothetical protein